MVHFSCFPFSLLSAKVTSSKSPTKRCIIFVKRLELSLTSPHHSLEMPSESGHNLCNNGYDVFTALLHNCTTQMFVCVRRILQRIHCAQRLFLKNGAISTFGRAIRVCQNVSLFVKVFSIDCSH